jgi:hypothetical protein
LPAIALSLLAVFITVAVNWYASLAALKTAALFFGLEGTVLLASAISPPDDMEEMPKNLLKKFMWSFTEGRRLAYPTHYNPVFFYGGLVFLAVSFVLSSI